MNFVSIGDLAQSVMLRRQNTQLQGHLQRLTEEMTSGRVADIGKALSGDFAALGGIDRSLASLAAYKVAIAEAELQAGALQRTLGRLQDLAAETGAGLTTAGSQASPTMVTNAAGDARQKFDAAIQALNTRVADRYLLSGIATDGRALADADTILAGLSTAVAGQMTVQGVVDAVTAWFEAPAGGSGYLDIAYTGAATALAPLGIAEDEGAALTQTAADPRIRDTLKGFALAALVHGGTFAGDEVARAGLLQRAGVTLMTTDLGVAELRAEVGTVEAQIAAAASRNGSETATLGLARAGLVSADPYDTATALAAVEGQIETLYTLTARVSQLSLTDYL